MECCSVGVVYCIVWYVVQCGAVCWWCVVNIEACCSVLCVVVCDMVCCHGCVGVVL